MLPRRPTEHHPHTFFVFLQIVRVLLRKVESVDCIPRVAAENVGRNGRAELYRKLFTRLERHVGCFFILLFIFFHIIHLKKKYCPTAANNTLLQKNNARTGDPAA